MSYYYFWYGDGRSFEKARERITHNLEKYEFSKNEIKFLGHIISEKRIKADSSKTAALREMQKATK